MAKKEVYFYFGNNLSIPITNIEVLDVYGRNILSLMSLRSQEHTLDIMHLNAGILFYENSNGKRQYYHNKVLIITVQP